MTRVWVTIALVAFAGVVIKGVGALILGRRELPERALGVVALFAPALLAALVVFQTFGATGGGFALDARAAGVAAAGVALALRVPLLLALLLAAGVAAGIRAV
jgi:hypothetical protein